MSLRHKRLCKSWACEHCHVSFGGILVSVSAAHETQLLFSLAADQVPEGPEQTGHCTGNGKRKNTAEGICFLWFQGTHTVYFPPTSPEQVAGTWVGVVQGAFLGRKRTCWGTVVFALQKWNSSFVLEASRKWTSVPCEGINWKGQPYLHAVTEAGEQCCQAVRRGKESSEGSCKEVHVDKQEESLGFILTSSALVKVIHKLSA